MMFNMCGGINVSNSLIDNTLIFEPLMLEIYVRYHGILIFDVISVRRKFSEGKGQPIYSK